MVRELAGWDPGRAKTIIRWPLREALLSYVSQLQKQAWRLYRFDSLIWAVLAPHAKKRTDPPKLPQILKG
jgi:hypothetical protein